MDDEWSTYLSNYTTGIAMAVERDFGNGNDLLEEWMRELQMQSRVSVVIATSFSIATSAAVIASVLYNSWQWSKRRISSEGPLDFLIKIPPVHIPPLALSIASLLQGAVFLTTQTVSLHHPLIHNCRAVAEATWTASWVPGYALLVISAETAYRCFKPHHLGRINPYARVLLRWLAISSVTIVVWLPSRIKRKDTDTCLAYMPRWIDTWSDVASGLAGTLIFMFATTIFVLKIRLTLPAVLCNNHKQAAKELVFYLVLNGILEALTLPFWIKSAISGQVRGKVESMASLALSLIGLANAALYLFLCFRRDDTLLHSEKSRCAVGLYRHELGSTELAVARQITKPIDLERNNSAAQLPNYSAEGKELPHNSPSAPIPTSRPPDSQAVLAKDSPPARNRKSHLEEPEHHVSFPRQSRHGSRYSVLPRRSSQLLHPSFHKLKLSNDSESLLRPPKPAFCQHRRHSSDVSSATVQIGLRLSNVAMPAAVHQGFQSVTPVSPVNRARSSVCPSQSTSPLEEADRDKALPPPPLMVQKSDKGKSPLRQTECAEYEGRGQCTSTKKAWPLPDRFSLLPKKVYRQGNWI